MNRNTIASLWAWGTFALILAAPLEADILSLAPPRLTPYDGQDIGDTQIGVSFTALATYTISAAGIKFNPFGNQTSQPKTYELDVYIYAVTGGTRGPLLANGFILLLSAYLLYAADSATSKSCLYLCGGIIAVVKLFRFGRRPAVVVRG